MRAHVPLPLTLRQPPAPAFPPQLYQLPRPGDLIRWGRTRDSRRRLDRPREQPDHIYAVALRDGAGKARGPRIPIRPARLGRAHADLVHLAAVRTLQREGLLTGEEAGG